MKKITEETIKNLSKLARIGCKEDEAKALLEDLKKILAFVDELKSVDTEGAPICHSASLHNQTHMREDKIEEVLDRNTFLQNAPDKTGGFIKVPPVIKKQP